jgi:hypothetical protein
LKRKQNELQIELTEYQEVFKFIQTRPPAEVQDIIRRIRSEHSVGSVLRLVQSGDPILESYNMSLRKASSPEVEQVDLEALQKSRIKVRANPWTTVAGDGVVSELISIFFEPMNFVSTSYVDMRCFLHDMESGNIRTAMFCTPLLVNAMCSFAAVRYIPI